MKLVTWNTQWCRGMDGIVSPERIVRVARELADFDVLCLQEIAVHYPRLPGGADHDQAAIIQRLLPGFEVFFGAAVDEFDALGNRSRFGNLVATRLPVLHAQHHPLPYPADEGKRSMPRMCSVVTLLDDDLGPLRVMTTHLEYYSKRQRLAQARALRALHAEYCGQAAAPPKPSWDGSPFQARVHTANAILCGDFNCDPQQPEYAELTLSDRFGRVWDSWRLLHPATPHPPTFRLYEPERQPVAFDFVFVSDGLKQAVKSIAVDSATQASDHQPVAVELR